MKAKRTGLVLLSWSLPAVGATLLWGIPFGVLVLGFAVWIDVYVDTWIRRSRT